MELKELNKTITILENHCNVDEAYFEFDYYDPDYVTIKSNKDGLMAFSLELIKACSKFDQLNGKENLYMNIKDWFVDEDNVFAPVITPFYSSRQDIMSKPLPKKKEPFAYHLTSIGLSALLCIIVGCFIIGFIQILMWIF